MNTLIDHIQSITPFKVNRQKLLRFLYAHKISADTLFFKLITASKLVRRDYLGEFADFEEEGIYED